MYQYQVSFGNAISRAFSNYCNFSGRASRSEFWWFTLFTAIVGTAISAVFMPISENLASVVSSIASIAFLLPSLGLYGDACMISANPDGGSSSGSYLLSGQ